MRQGSGYLRQRRGELDHHVYFGERPSAYLTYSHVRLQADFRTGIADVTATSIAKGTGLSVKMVRTDLRWLTEADDVTGRPAYLTLLEHGNQHRPSRYEVVKYPRTDSEDDEGAVTPGGHSSDPSSYPVGALLKGSSYPVGIGHKGSSVPMGIGHDDQRTQPQGVATPKKKEKKKEKNKNPSTKYPTSTDARARSGDDAEGFFYPVTKILSDHRHSESFAAELGMAIHLHARFNRFFAKFLAETIIPDFSARRKKNGATPKDLIRYARTRMSKLIESEASRNLVTDEQGIVRPGTTRFVAFVDHHVTEPWRRVEAALKENP